MKRQISSSKVPPRGHLAADDRVVTDSLGMATAAALLDDAVLDTLIVISGPD
jgi:hypothetical protein